MKKEKEKHSDGESTYRLSFTEKFRLLRGMKRYVWKMAPERRTELKGIGDRTDLAVRLRQVPPVIAERYTGT